MLMIGFRAVLILFHYIRIASFICFVYIWYLKIRISQKVEIEAKNFYISFLEKTMYKIQAH